MKQAWILLLVATVTMSAAMGQARAADGDAAKSMADLSAKTRNAMGLVKFTVKDEVTGEESPQAVYGMGICVDAKGDTATLITTGLGGQSGLPPVVVKVEVAVPGVEKTLVGSYVSTDPGSGITFIQVKGDYKWQTVAFAEKADLPVGRQVFSVGLLDNWLGYEPYLGMGHVSARLRVPAPLVYVTGGTLTNIGSPVFTADGVAVGIVLQQLPTDVEIMTGGGGGGRVIINSRRETTCFVPVDDFAYVLKAPPAAGKRPTWTGITQFDRYPEEVIPLNTSAVKVVNVVAGSPAAKAGLEKGAVITQFNGKPLEKLASEQLTRSNLERLLARLPAGTDVTLGLSTGKSVTFKVEDLPPTWRDAAKYANPTLGLVVREKIGLDAVTDPGPTATEKGLYVLAVAKSSPADTAGLKGGNEFNLVVSVGATPVSTVADFKRLVEAQLASAPKGPITLGVMRGGQKESVTLTVK